jgi:orotidine-5'-phosphate decarboxylase
MKNIKGLIVALDLETVDKAKALVRQIGKAGTFYKVPPSLHMQDPGLVSWLKDQGKDVFLDCKWYDIPSQVQRSVQAAGKAGVTACTIHVSAGSEALKAALLAYPRPKIWGVTVLTSLGKADLAEVGVPAEPADQVLRLAALAQKHQIDGLVCSPLETARLRENGISLTLITPGIQWAGGGGKDQRRVASPQQAWSDGANYIVVGRAITEAKDPAAAARDIAALAPQ